MERRFVLFLVLAFLVLMINMLLSALLFPRKPPAAQKDDEVAAVEKPEKERAKPERPKAPEADDEQPADETAPANEEPPAEVAAPEEAPAANADAGPPSRRLSLGSYDPASGYRLLVTLASAGAAVERVELNSPRYREQEDRSGYIGHLAPADAPQAGGCVLQVVGHGTPAALAGLEPGDVIEQLNDKRITTAADFESALKETQAGDEIRLIGQRNDQPLKLSFKLGRRPLEIIRPEFNSKPVDVVASEHDPLSLLMTIEQAGKRRLGKEHEELPGVHLRDGNWEVVRSSIDEAVFRRRLEKLALEVTKRYRLAKAEPPDDNPDSPDYNLLLDLQIRNISDKTQDVAYRLDGPTGLPLEGAWYATKISHTWGAAGMRDVIVRFNGSGNSVVQESCAAIVDAKEGKMAHWTESDGLLDFIAVDTQYFSSAVLPRRPQLSSIWFEDVRPIRVGDVPTDKSEKKLTDVSFRMTSKAFELPPGESLRHDYELFAGPKKPALLDQYVNGDSNLGELVYYGWFGGSPSRCCGCCTRFTALVHNYGLAIVMLTVLVRGCMFPLSRKQAISAQKMQELQPEIQEDHRKIQESRKSAPRPSRSCSASTSTTRSAAACWFSFQLPVFVGLYRSLMVDVELRQAPLISDSIRWASNLAAPDMLWDWGQIHARLRHRSATLGPYLNLFPLVTIGLFIWQQKMFMPPPADEQTAMQQKMMPYMMIFMGVMFFKVACGLCLYFIASSLWGITERKLLPKSTLASPPVDAAGKSAVPVRSDGGNGAAGGKSARPAGSDGPAPSDANEK